MSTVTKPGKLNSSSSSANEVIGEARRILRREAGGVRYDPRTSLTLPPLTGIRYGLESPSPTSRFGHLGRPNVGRGSFGKGSQYVCLTLLSSAVAKSRIARQLGRSRMHRAAGGIRHARYRAFCTKVKSKTWLGGISLAAPPRVFWVNSMAPFIQFSSTDPSTDWRVK